MAESLPASVDAECGRGGLARAFGRFIVAALVTSLCLWAYLRVGAGAAGIGGLALLVAPVALLAAALLVPWLKGAARPAWASLVVGAALPYLLVSCVLPEWTGRRPFDPVAWKAAAGGKAQDWIRQVDALIASGTLDRKTRASVLDLLGPDDSAAGTGWGQGYFPNWGLVYWLGDERSFMSVDSE